MRVVAKPFLYTSIFLLLRRLPTVLGDDEVHFISNISTLPGARRNTRQGSVPSKHSRIDVLVVLEGPTDDTTSLTFRDIAETVQDGLHGLGHPSRAIYCTNIALDNCLDEGGKVIVLAAHNLASFLTAEGDSAVLKWKLLPPDAVLYNFEQVPRNGLREPLVRGVAEGGGRDSSLISARTLQIYARYTLWDYSEQNVKVLRDMGIHADLVPLGFSSKLESSGHAVGVNQVPQHEDVDVLFVGMGTPTRKATLRRLREAGLTVVHPNAEGIALYGAENDVMSAKSKIVLSLNAFRGTEGECSSSSSSNGGSGTLCNKGEWKMPRLARLLANGRFVVSEMSGTSAERAKYSGGVVFVEREQLAETCKFYLDRPELRKAIAARGRQLFERQREEEILRKPVEAILGRGDGGIPKAITM